jgi:hypothetical protein
MDRGYIGGEMEPPGEGDWVRTKDGSKVQLRPSAALSRQQRHQALRG